MRNLMVLVFVFVALVIGGCAGIGQSVENLGSMRDQAMEIQNDLQSQLDELALMRESIPDDSVQGNSIDALISQVNAKLALVEAAIVHTNQVLQGATNPSDPLTIATDAISPWVPAPIQAPLVLGAALLATIMRSRSLSTGTRSIVESINYVLKKDDSFNAAFAANADTIRTIQTPAAQRIVNKWTP